MCTHIFIVILTASSCFCYAGYELFQGFYVNDAQDLSDTTTKIVLNSSPNIDLETSQVTTHGLKNERPIPNEDKNSTKNKNIAPTIAKLTKKSKLHWSLYENSHLNEKDITETTVALPMYINCPEDVKPTNIGPYEVPNQRDFVLFTRNVVLDMFNSYNKQAFYLLKDMRAATRATSSVEKKCPGNTVAYRQCVKHVSNQYQQITKSFIKDLENKKQEIADLTKGTICNLSEMKTDPISMLKSLAQEKVTLDFALPGFLRILSACSLNCNQLAMANNYNKTLLRHMTDQDLVVKHFPTR